MLFRLNSSYTPAGDQPQAIQALVDSLQAGNRYQTLLGVTGSGKTFTMANVIQKLQRPALILSHNKTLAAQLYSEFKRFFPENAVEYFVSYYDYYQPEAYLPATDTYIEKDASINDDIDRLRIAATSALVSREDVIVISSVSCIYGLGSPEDFQAMMIPLKVGDSCSREGLLMKLVENLYERNDVNFQRSTFRVRGDTVDIFPSYQETAIRVVLFGDEIEAIYPLDPLTGEKGRSLPFFNLYPAKPYITPKPKIDRAISEIRKELTERVAQFEKEGRLLEAQRIKMRTEYDIEMLQEIGFCTGIENYSRHLMQRPPGSRPSCLLDFFPKDFLLFIDESHVTVSQIRGMYVGDSARKERLVDFGFRLPSAMDNRPMRPEEFDADTGQTIFVSATPAAYEVGVSKVIAEQVVRPTGLLDPIMEVRPLEGQVKDLLKESRICIEKKQRVLVTTLTKRMSEDLSAYLAEAGIRVEYLHSDIDALERVEILRRLRKGEFDVLVGVNLLREGLDLPEVGLVAILDADKEGFLRSETSLIQTAGRAARHSEGRVILYADVMTRSLQAALDITQQRRARQMAYNEAHGITPQTVQRAIEDSMKETTPVDPVSLKEAGGDEDLAATLAELETEMLDAAKALKFEKAAHLRDQIQLLKKQLSKEDPSPKVKKKGRGK
jgi:excinuclease ABC subunit B